MISVDKVVYVKYVIGPKYVIIHLTRPTQTSEFEALFASLGNELQNRCLCPSCHRDNAEASGVTLQTSSGS